MDNDYYNNPNGGQNNYQNNYWDNNPNGGNGYQEPNNTNPNKKNKKNNKWQKFLIVFASICAGLIFIGGVYTVCQSVIGYVRNSGQQSASTEDGSADNGQNEDAGAAGDSKDSENEEAISTTKPISVVESGGVSGTPVDVSEIVEESMPSVVSIVSTTSVEGYSVFGQHYEQEVPTGGTGFIVGQNDKELLLATNNHVVEDATAIQVTFVDESTAEAIVKGTDAQADLAVIAVALEDIDESTLDAIKVAVLGDSDDIKVGQMAIAIGNAQGMGQSVTVGYISAKDRKLDMSDEAGGTKTMNFLQTDAAINGGNSGGPLLNVNGEVVGINSAKISDTQVEGMCFAIPISSAIPIINDLMNRETLTEEEKGYMGVTLQNISSDAVEMYGVPDGVYVASVKNGGPADNAGIKEGDIIVSINDTAVNSSSAAVDKVNSLRAGSEVTVKLYRQNSQKTGYDEIEAKVTLVTAKEAGIDTNDAQSANPGSGDNGGGNGNNGENPYNYDDYFDNMIPW